MRGGGAGAPAAGRFRTTSVSGIEATPHDTTIRSEALGKQVYNSLKNLIPDADALLLLEADELGSALLEHLHSPDVGNRGAFHPSGVLTPITEQYPREQRDRIEAVLSEAWTWLQREGLLVPKPGDQYGWMILSRRGVRLKARADVEAYRHGQLLPRKQLHPTMVAKVYSTFLRGDYDTAVFQAFKEVEVAVREAAKLAPIDLGVALMRKAFDKAVGPLTDMGRPEAEREATAHLFAGAIGLYKNPHSHRNVPLTDPSEAVEIIMLASHLLRIVDGLRGS